LAVAIIMNKTLIHIDPTTLPPRVRPYIHGARTYDSSCSDMARTIYLEGDIRAFLKIAQAGKLAREVQMNRFMHSHGLAPAVLEFVSDEYHDYLLTEALEGEDGISDGHLQAPDRLAAVFGESLRLVHQLPVRECPIQGRTAELISESQANINRGYKDSAIITEDLSPAARQLDRLKALGRDEVVIHGDYCLPNILLRDFRLSGFVDLGTGGVGDRHYDLFWGIWTLAYNLKTDRYKDVFLDAYGRQELDPERLELSRLLAGFTQ